MNKLCAIFLFCYAITALSGEIAVNTDQETVDKIAEIKPKHLIPEETLDSYIYRVANTYNLKIIVDPRVKGVTSVLNVSVENEETYYDDFLSVLNIHGFTAVKETDKILVIPLNSAKQFSLPILEEGKRFSSNEFVIETINLQYASGEELQDVLRHLVAKTGYIRAVKGSNSLVLLDRYENIKKIKKLIGKLDIKQVTIVE